jgi:Ca2+-binding EF-hand superfamily protein
MSYTFNNHELKELFNELDTDGDGIVDLNEDINKYDKFPLLQEIFKTIGDRKLKFEEFKKEITDLLNEKKDDSGLSYIYDFFKNNSKKDTISKNEFYKITEELDLDYNNDEIEQLFSLISDKGQITFDSFANYMNQ